ncbi:MAG: nitroreductase family protein [Proteobacteria bacterium]|jgi:nitroreductase|nr:NAD(P)H-dependent dehydrogenase/reductase [Desulfocapsa sp.]MBU3946192.1 nitroreductase family protein [Pseudomonadota bacterium]MCG2745204.1 nitroreductase family protein [Desulfobacteraceae bacterium]MBU3981916.1 nitroreductase family protein [Pseudomonadota bacterium]MBU4027815.1 nitroreductase family protein [Pseudomonadota bacterium]
MFIDLLRARRSIRRFQDQPVEKEKRDLLLEAMLRSPSSRGLNPWEFVVVTEKETLLRLSHAKPHGASFLKNAPLAIVVCADPAKCDVWVEDCSISSILLHLAAADLGLGSCWVQIRLREHDTRHTAQEYVAGIIGLKEGMVVESIIGIGYPAEQLPGHSRSSLQDEKVSFEKYGQKK